MREFACDPTNYMKIARIQVRKSGSTSLPCRQYSDKRLVFLRTINDLVAFGLSQIIDNATFYLCVKSRIIGIAFVVTFSLTIVAVYVTTRTESRS
jgi:hypothetical protein